MKAVSFYGNPMLNVIWDSAKYTDRHIKAPHIISQSTSILSMLLKQKKHSPNCINASKIPNKSNMQCNDDAPKSFNDSCTTSKVANYVIYQIK